MYLADARERVLDLHHLADVLGFEVVLVEVLGHAVDLVERGAEVLQVIVPLGCVFDEFLSSGRRVSPTFISMSRPRP